MKNYTFKLLRNATLQSNLMQAKTFVIAQSSHRLSGSEALRWH